MKIERAGWFGLGDSESQRRSDRLGRCGFSVSFGVSEAIPLCALPPLGDLA
jgi:hypothetical protein